MSYFALVCCFVLYLPCRPFSYIMSFCRCLLSAALAPALQTVLPLVLSLWLSLSLSPSVSFVSFLMEAVTVESLKATLLTRDRSQRGLALDIDETLSATNVAWFQRLVALFGNPEPELSVAQLVRKYHLAQNNPAWQSDDAQQWMQVTLPPKCQVRLGWV